MRGAGGSYPQTLWLHRSQSSALPACVEQSEKGEESERGEHESLRWWVTSGSTLGSTMPPAGYSRHLSKLLKTMKGTQPVFHRNMKKPRTVYF